MQRAALCALLLLAMVDGRAVGPSGAAGSEQREARQIVRDPDVPDLPFDDNPDPLLCGIPQPFGEPSRAFLSGYWQGEPIQERVLLYDSHLRRSVVGGAPHNTEIKILLYQVNPELNYYLVRTVGLGEDVEGWIPAPFVRFPGDPDPAAGGGG